MSSNSSRSYTGLLEIPTFNERFEYLSLNGQVGQETFGFERYLNQQFYRSREWRSLRDFVITRDEGRDLGVEGYEIYDQIIIHHIIPITVEDLEIGNPLVLDPDNLITTTHNTHNAIHYGTATLLREEWKPREPGDHILWPSLTQS